MCVIINKGKDVFATAEWFDIWLTNEWALVYHSIFQANRMIDEAVCHICTALVECGIIHLIMAIRKIEIPNCWFTEFDEGVPTYVAKIFLSIYKRHTIIGWLCKEGDKLCGFANLLILTPHQ